MFGFSKTDAGRRETNDSEEAGKQQARSGEQKQTSGSLKRAARKKDVEEEGKVRASQSHCPTETRSIGAELRLCTRTDPNGRTRYGVTLPWEDARPDARWTRIEHEASFALEKSRLGLQRSQEGAESRGDGEMMASMIAGCIC